MRPLGPLALLGLLAFAAPGLAADHVSVGVVGNASDAGFLIARANGYFRDEGLDVEFVPFDAAQKMMAPIGAGDLDVGGGAASASLYNAAARGLGIRVVADRSRTEPGNQFQTLMIRKALVDSGRYKTLADLKGLKIALLAPGGSPGSTLNEAVKKAGIPYESVERVYMPFPPQVAAFKNGAIDGSIMIEPFATAIVAAGDGVRVAPTEDFYPNDQIGMVFFSEKLANGRKAVGARFAKAYVRALRDYNDALRDGRFSPGPMGSAIVAILAKGLGLAEADIRAAFPPAMSPDGKPHIESLRKDLAFFKAQGDVTDDAIQVEKLLDMSFVDAAVAALGPYAPKRD
jgi:NitT/TauT family transport system substrate-binding protein